MTEKLLVPDIGDFENVEVIELLVKEGQEIKINDPVVTIESDKSSVEIPSTFSGKIETIKVKVGDKVSKGDLILNISNSNKETTSSEDVPKNTENLIQEAENFLKKNEEKKILTQNNSVTGVQLNNGEVFESKCVMSNSDPKTTYLNLLGAQILDTDFIRRTKNFRNKGNVAKLELELENEILRKNVSELQEQLQNAYVRIKDLTNPKQLELDL